MSPVRYELGFYIPEDGILHSHRRESLQSYKTVGVPAEFRHKHLLNTSPYPRMTLNLSIKYIITFQAGYSQ
jgi:hypothetical protein